MLLLLLLLSLLFLYLNDNNILFTKKKQKILACLKVTLSGTGFQPGTVEFPTYLSSIP